MRQAKLPLLNHINFFLVKKGRGGEEKMGLINFLLNNVLKCFILTYYVFQLTNH